MAEPAGAAVNADGTYRRPITVLIADDQQMVRRGFRVILEAEQGISVVAEAGDGREAVELARRHAPAVALLDIRMPVMDGLHAARQILALSSRTRVLILTTFDADEYVYEALRVGASGFLLKDAPADQLVTAVRSLAAGDALIDPVITRRLISRFALAARPAGVPDELSQLTPRELEVLRLVARGLSNIEIAQELVVEENTVKTHVSRILTKLGLRDRVQAVVLAYELGFVTPEARG
jgi:DNA-binding NarL/FixJ family response regulator